MHTRRQFVFAAIVSIPALAQKQKDDTECNSLRNLATAPISADAKTMRLDLQSETFDDSDAHRLAIADLIQDHFSHWIIVDPNAKTKLHVTGTNLNGSAQVVEIEFGWKAYQLIQTRLDPALELQ